MNIIKANLSDLDKIRKLNKAVFVNNPNYDEDLIPDYFDTESGIQYLKDTLNDPTGIFLILEDNNQWIGYVNGAQTEIPYRKSKYFEIHNLGIVPEFKGQGMGKLLLDEIEKLAKKAGFQKIYLECYSMNSEALNFYRKNGFNDIDVSLEKKI